MRMKKVHTNCLKKIRKTLMFLGLLLLCGCAERGSDAYFFKETEDMPESESAEATEANPQEGVQNGISGGAGEGGEQADEAEPVTQEGDDACRTAVCIVHICGAVKEPGVYELPEGSRVMDAVNAGGGFLDEADPEACNLAQPVTDGCQIYIMTKEESRELEAAGKSAGIQRAPTAQENAAASVQPASEDGAEGAQRTESGGKVNLNTADAAALKTLPGIGDSRAAAIIAYRQEHGKFTCIEDIMKVSGIKQAAFEKIKDRITV